MDLQNAFEHVLAHAPDFLRNGNFLQQGEFCYHFSDDSMQMQHGALRVPINTDSSIHLLADMVHTYRLPEHPDLAAAVAVHKSNLAATWPDTFQIEEWRNAAADGLLGMDVQADRVLFHSWGCTGDFGLFFKKGGWWDKKNQHVSADKADELLRNEVLQADQFRNPSFYQTLELPSDDINGRKMPDELLHR